MVEINLGRAFPKFKITIRWVFSANFLVQGLDKTQHTCEKRKRVGPGQNPSYWNYAIGSLDVRKNQKRQPMERLDVNN